MRQKTTETRLIASLLHRADSIPPHEAEILLSHVLGRPREYVIAHDDEIVPRRHAWKFFRAVHKRSNGIPIARLTGHKEFYGLDFFVNKHTLVPRPETELIVECALGVLSTDYGLQTTTDHCLLAVDRNPSSVVLIDVGTGTGCIPISMIKTIQQWNNGTMEQLNIQTYATDISRSALRVAKKNAKQHGVDISFLRGDLLEPVLSKFSPLEGRDRERSHVVITANLPYLTREQFASEPSIQHEPKSALVADDNGLALYKKLLNQIQSAICPAAAGQSAIIIFLEIDPSQSAQLCAYIQSKFPGMRTEIKKDLAGRDRVIKIFISSAAGKQERK